MFKDSAKNKHNLEAFSTFCRNVKFQWIGKNGSTTTHKYYLAQKVSQHYIAQLFRDIIIPIENKKFNTDGLAEYIEDSDIFPYWDVVIANGDSNEAPFMDVHPVKRSFHMRSEDDLIRIGGSNNRVLDPGLLNAGLWYREGETLSAKEYCNHRTVPILVVFPIDLNCDNKTDDADTKKWKKDTKDGLDGNVLIAFAYGFPGTDSKVMVKYRANAIMIDQLTKGIELDDEDEGVDDFGD